MIVNDVLVNPQILMGKRVKLIEPMNNDPFPVERLPIEVGSEGVVYHVGRDVINVRWDNGRTLGLINGKDIFEVLN
jgi:hypothetical protein